MPTPLQYVEAGDKLGPPGAYYKDLRLEFQLCFALYSTINKLARIYNHRLEPVGLTFPQTLALLVLWESSPRTVGEIAAALELENGSVTPLLKRLEQGGFVLRVRDAADERRVNVHVTPRGLALKQPIIDMRQELMRTLAVADAEVETLRNSLRHFSAILSRAEP